MSRFKRFALVGLILIFCAVPALGAQQLRVVGSWSNLTLYKNFEQPFWTKTLPEAMNGKIETIMTSLGQVNMTGAAVLRPISLGVFDVVCTVADYVVSDCPELAGLDLPSLALDIKDARKVVDAYFPVMEKAIEKSFGAKLLAVVPYPAQVLFTTVPIETLEDLKGKKIRASGWTTSQFIDALGATGVNISFGEVAQSLQQGIVEGAVTGSLSGYNAGWGEVTKYVYPLPVGGWDYVITVMGLNVWNAFSPEEQEQIRTLIKTEMELPAWEVTAEETQLGINALTGTGDFDGTPNNLTLIPVAPGDLELAKKILVEKVLPAWAEKVDPQAVKDWNDTIGAVTGLKAE